MVGTEGERERHARAKEVYFEALELPRDQREALLRARCGDDPALLSDVRSLLEQELTGDGFLERPLELGAPALELPQRLPERIGAYAVLSRLGFGGMGVVYLAEQERPRRRVALKVLRLDAASETARRRFARESEALARLAHPGIAHVLEAGVADTDVGAQPFIAMEYVEGRPIVAHAERAGLAREARVGLVLEVARAVAHAHERGVLHRDLKPDNVLVDGEGRPRVLDFGVAHVVGDDDALSQLTATGHVVGTLAYMAPEQARGGRIDARADVYALGVILYELLTGRLPLETRGRPLHAALTVHAEGAWTPASSHDASLRGDLDAILATALAEDPGRRYRSVTELADDLERFLDGRPVTARAPSALYQLSRWSARHKALVVGLALGLVALLGLAIVLGGMLRARADAQGLSRVALLLSDFELMNELEARERELHPAVRATLPRMDAWLEDARGLYARVDAHTATIEELQSGATLAGVDLSAADAERFSRQAAGFLTRIEGLAAAEDGLLPSVERRRGLAATVHARSVEAYADEWQAAAARVRRHPDFAGLELAPQEGLVPLGPDPGSGLEEFALLDGTGALPTRDAAGRVVCGGETGVVLVLIPGGEVLVGYQADDPQGANYHRNGHRAESAVSPESRHFGPPAAVRLDPYLISKFELTQGQWRRAFGGNPSYWEVGEVEQDEAITDTNPVESVSHDEAVVLLAQLGLSLPTEAQWEHAARGGLPVTSGIPAEGNFDVSYPQLALVLAPPRDDYRLHAPVGRFGSNGYGLCDVMGNVWELCLDDYKVDYHELPLRDGDGLVLEDGDPDRPRRGGGYLAWAAEYFVGFRSDILRNDRLPTTGVRPARPLSGCGFEPVSGSHPGPGPR